MFNVGENVFLRKITMILTGRVVAIHDTYIELDNAAWIADTGRYAHAVRTGEFSEVEPYPDYLVVKVPLGDLVDGFVTLWPLPRTQK
jgi:hypothetical protein